MMTMKMMNLPPEWSRKVSPEERQLLWEMVTVDVSSTYTCKSTPESDESSAKLSLPINHDAVSEMSCVCGDSRVSIGVQNDGGLDPFTSLTFVKGVDESALTCKITIPCGSPKWKLDEVDIKLGWEPV